MSWPQGGSAPQGTSRDHNIVQADVSQRESSATVLLEEELAAATFVAESALLISPGFVIANTLANVTGTYFLYRFESAVTSSSFISQVPKQRSFLGNLVGLSNEVFSFWRMAQFNSGVLPHLPNTFSDLYKYDVVSTFNFLGQRTIHFLEILAATIFSTEPFDVIKNIVSTDYYTTISGSTDVCEGDGEPPFITLHSPTISGAHLRPRDQIIDFSLTDAVGGVDISTVVVNIYSASVSGTIIQNGIDQTSGDVSVIGNPVSYRFTYIPPFLWEYNEQVLVTISGTDLPPTVDGNPFFCGTNGVNTFIGDIPFQVLNFEDFPAEITAVGDTDPPFVQNIFPSSGTLGNSVFTSVSLDIVDTLTGVDLSNTTVSVGSIPILNNGVPTGPETSIVGTASNYSVVYTPSTSFNYGQTVLVEVSSQDRATPTPNAMSLSYSFSCIDDSSLIISNFQPAVGTHVNPEDIDVVVDVTDASHGIDSDQTFFVINGTLVSGTREVITDGFKLTYHPPNDFAFNEPMRVVVHGTNGDVVAPVVKEAFYTLFYGCRIFMFNEEPFNHLEKIDVFVRARNNEQLHKDLTTGYFFTTYTQPQTDLGASIEGITPYVDLPANLNAQGPEHRYGETVTVEFSVEDFDERILGPYTFTYTIENRPE